MPDDAIQTPLHKIEGIVTPDKYEFGVHRMRVAGGWIYWLQPMGGAYVSQFVPDIPSLSCFTQEPAPAMLCPSVLDELTKELVQHLMRKHGAVDTVISRLAPEGAAGVAALPVSLAEAPAPAPPLDAPAPAPAADAEKPAADAGKPASDALALDADISKADAPPAA